MPRFVRIITITFESMWSSGCLTITGQRKALTFIRNLRNNHIRFIKQYNWNGMWCGQPISENQTKLKVKFETTVQPVKRKKLKTTQL